MMRASGSHQCVVCGAEKLNSSCYVYFISRDWWNLQFRHFASAAVFTLFLILLYRSGVTCSYFLDYSFIWNSGVKATRGSADLILVIVSWQHICVRRLHGTPGIDTSDVSREFRWGWGKVGCASACNFTLTELNVTRSGPCDTSRPIRALFPDLARTVNQTRRIGFCSFHLRELMVLEKVHAGEVK